MPRPEIVMQTPAAKQLELAVQQKLAEYTYSTPEDVVMAEYVVVMLANAKTPEQITAELTELIGEDMYNPAFTDWLFEEVARQYGLSTTEQDESLLETTERVPQSPADDSQVPTINLGGKIETVQDSRDNHPPHRGTLKRPGNGVNNLRPGPGIYKQAVGGIKRPAANDLIRDTPSNRRIRSDDPYSSLPPGSRSDRNSRDSAWSNNGNAHSGPAMGLNRRDLSNGSQLAPGNFPPSGHGPGSETAGKSILERVGIVANANRPFPPGGLHRGYDNQGPPLAANRRMHDQMRNGPPSGRPHIPPQAMFYGAVPPYAPPILPNNQFPPQNFHPQNISHQPTPQLFLANGQPYIPAHPFPFPGPVPGAPHANMYPHPLFHPAMTPSVQAGAQQPGSSAGILAKTLPAIAPPPPKQQPEVDLTPLPRKPLLRQECKYNLKCKNAWCPSSHCSPQGNNSTSMLLNFDPCEKQLECTDPDCAKAHVSPQQRDPKASIKPPTAVLTGQTATIPQPSSYSPSLPASNSNPTLCRFGLSCTRPDCIFTHPWGNKPGASKESTALSDKEASIKASFASIPCKFGLGCARPACHFQHPPTAQSLSGHRMSKNISKTFNNSETASAGALGSSKAEPLSPSKKFTKEIKLSEPGTQENILPSETAETADPAKNGCPLPEKVTAVTAPSLPVSTATAALVS